MLFAAARRQPSLARLILLMGFAFSVALGAGCEPRCRSSSACEPGEHCDFLAGICKIGCKSDDDCSATARCNVELGNCRATIFLPNAPDAAMDAGTSTRTSTTPDGG